MGELRGERVTLRPLQAADAPALLAIHETPEVQAWWGKPEPGFPDDEPTSTRFTILVDGKVAGLLQYSEERDPDYMSAELDIFLAPHLHGRGYGSEAIDTLVRHLVAEHGHHRIEIAADTENSVAIRCYENAGFRRIGVAHAACRHPLTGEWRDDLLLERVEL